LDRLPGLIRSRFNDFPQMLQSQREEILQSDEDGSIDNGMRVFEESLRNSFSVSDLQRDQEITVPGRPPVDEPWRAACPSVMKRATEGVVAAQINLGGLGKKVG
jgi:hypothetical protein